MAARDHSRGGWRPLFALGMMTLAALLLPGGVLRADDAPRFELRPGDRVSIVGNTLAERMQHDGWLETLLQGRFPEHRLAFRNLGFSGDELTTRLRSAGFGSPDDWLTRTQADVVFAFFGYNESFAGEAGLEKFKSDLANFIKQTLEKQYNGRSAPRLVLFSPIAHEDLKDRNLPDGRENNERISLYTQAMAEVAKANGVPFVDLYKPTQPLYDKSAEPLTINGVHLNQQGNRLIAEAIIGSLVSDSADKKSDPQKLEPLRQAVLDKNFHWFHRYRTVDGYSIYGGRADLKFVDGQTNREVMQREMEILDVMTANRDERIWRVARSLGENRALRSDAVKLSEVDDSNVPEFIPVKTNKPGTGPNGEHVFLSGEEAISKMTVAEGMQVNLFACEQQFPELISPVQMAFDTRGRLWVATWPTYPHWTPKGEMNDSLLILEDTTGDGKADTCKAFADDLHCPTGFDFWNGGVLIAQAPDVWFLKDTTGDDKADVRVRVLGGICSADTHHAANSFTLDPGGALYFQEGTFHHTQVESPWGPTVRLANAGVFRYEPRSQKFEVYVSYGFANPHGHVFDRWGQDIVVDGTGAVPYHGTLFSGRVEFPQKHARPPQVYQQRTRPCAGIEFLSSRHFPDENQGNLLLANVIGFQGIQQYKIEDKGSSFSGTEVEPIVFSSDPHFRPSDIEMGPDGAIYFTDWQNPIIGHMQHNLRDPSRDRVHGRVYRVTYPSRPLLKPAKIAGEPIDKLLDLLKEPEDRTRYRTRIELSGRDSDEVIAAVRRWMAALDKNHPEYEHHLLEALWVHQHHNAVNPALLKRMLGSTDFRARAAAVRVLCYWRDRVSDSLEMLKSLAADEHPRVRLEAVRAASFYTVPEAVEVPLIAAELSSDEYLDYTRGETMKTLERHWKQAVAQGREIAVTSDAGARFFLRSMSLDKLLTMERSRGVSLELLFRPGVRDEQRREALTGLARMENKPDLRVLVEAIRTQDERPGTADESVMFDLVRLLTGRSAEELAGIRNDLEKLATGANLPVTRQLGFVALVTADESVDKAWELAVGSPSALRDLLGAMPVLPDLGQRAALYPKVEPLLEGLPPQIAALPQSKASYGRYVRIELPGQRKTLTLAEVEVSSDGRNVARQGKATQINTAHGGAAQRAINGNKSGNFSDGGQSHTVENIDNPWWEVDLGREYPIESVVIFNRTESTFGRRLNGFTLKVLDKERNVVFQKERQTAPEESVAYEIGGGTETLVRQAAMVALTSVRGQEAHTFKTLARFIRDDRDRPAAVQALQRIPPRHWPADEARPLLDGLIAWLRELPPQDRTTQAALDALQFGDSLAALLPAEQARSVRRDLGELGVRILRIGTVPHQMIFDKERLAVQAGKPVEFVFENTDIMPHNIVFIRPGSLEQIGEQAEATAQQPGALERHYVPQSEQVLLGSELLQPRQSQRLSFNTPTEPGIYPYVCTYPGHWRRMYGALYVVDDLEQYQADPEAYLAAHPLPIEDELLKFNRPRKEWTFDELAAALPELGNGRSFSNGRQMFQVANCAACHKLNGVGQEFGPDLTKLDPMKKKPTDLLRDTLDPSADIEDKYRTWVFVTDAGRTVTGMIIEETPETVQVIENPLAKSEPVTLKKSEIDHREASKQSIMPKGLLDKLTRDEVLDLLAYIAARGNQRHPLFQGGHDHQHGHH